MVCAESTVQWTAQLNGCLEAAWQGTGFVVLALAQVVGSIRGEQGAHCSMLWTGLEHIHLVVLQDDLGLNDLQTLGAEAVGEVVIDVGTVMTSRIYLFGVPIICRRVSNLYCLLERFAVAHGVLLRIRNATMGVPVEE